MVAPRSLLELLLGGMRKSQTGMAPDDPAEVARRYPRNGAPDDQQDEMRMRAAPSAAPVLDRDFRQLSRAPFAVGGQASGGASARSDLPDWAWAATPQDSRPGGAYGASSMMPWGAPPSPPPLPVWPGRGIPVPRGGLGGPLPVPWPSGRLDFRMREIPELPDALKLLYWPLLQSQPEPIRKRLLGERDEREDAESPVAPIDELEARRKKPAPKVSDRPATILNAPGVVPDAPGEAPDTTEETDYCDERLYEELERCRTRYPRKYSECKAVSDVRKDLCYRNHRRMKEGKRPLDVPEKYGND